MNSSSLSSSSGEDTWSHLFNDDFQKMQFFNLQEAHVRRTRLYRTLFYFILVFLSGIFAFAIYMLWESSPSPTTAATAAATATAASPHTTAAAAALEQQAKAKRAQSWAHVPAAFSPPDPLLMSWGHKKNSALFDGATK